MDNYTATMICEGVIEAEDNDQVLEAWCFLANNGLLSQLQGFFGRTFHSLAQQQVVYRAADGVWVVNPDLPSEVAL